MLEKAVSDSWIEYVEPDPVDRHIHRPGGRTSTIPTYAKYCQVNEIRAREGPISFWLVNTGDIKKIAMCSGYLCRQIILCTQLGFEYFFG